MKKLSKIIKAAVSTVKPTQKVKGKELYAGGETTGNSSHCQGGGGW
ncbi:hypothetical protein PEC311524_26940 [Pectobacterium carotovorum subsp. carotovorum]|nr:hypothetical protein [Pectobacterium punjabense]MBS4430553.1 hypothetical protein [Pectobacterium punjabense]GKW25100.1 hypothetical protein PEC311524_26940 [Pectobacterium carotovorum subsp. carotovorum]